MYSVATNGRMCCLEHGINTRKYMTKGLWPHFSNKNIYIFKPKDKSTRKHNLKKAKEKAIAKLFRQKGTKPKGVR